MTLQLEDLYKQQAILDKKVETGLPEGYEVDSWYCLEDKIFSFHVEVMELANEIKFFKFWKKDAPINIEETTEELVDCLHFLLSIGNTKGYTFINNIEPFTLWEDYNFLELFKLLRDNTLDTVGKFELALGVLLGVAYKLGITEETIYEAYSHKNAKNVKRQLEGY